MPSDPCVKKIEDIIQLTWMKKQVDNTIFFAFLLFHGEFKKMSPSNEPCTCKSATEYCIKKKKSKK